MPNKIATRWLLFLLVFSVFFPGRAAGQSQSNYTYGPLPVFELHSGFWINLHHTLYHQARLRKEAASAEKTGKSSGPALKTSPDAKPAFTAAEQKAWDDAGSYYSANLAH